MSPVVGGYWRQHETWDGTYTMDDLLDIREVMAVKYENDRRQQESEKEGNR